MQIHVFFKFIRQSLFGEGRNLNAKKHFALHHQLQHQQYQQPKEYQPSNRSGILNIQVRTIKFVKVICLENDITSIKPDQ